MNWLDFAIIVTILWFTLSGLSAGLIRELTALIASFAGVFLAGRLYPRLADDIKIVHDDPRVARLIAFIAIFAATFLAGELIGSFLKHAASMLLLGTVDRLAGLVFGFFEGCVVVELLLIGFAAFPAAAWMTRAIDGSLLAPVFLSGVPVLLHLLPGSFRKAVHGF